MTEGYWTGKPIEELTKQELLEILDHMSRELAEFRIPEHCKAYGVGKAMLLKQNYGGLK